VSLRPDLERIARLAAQKNLIPRLGKGFYLHQMNLRFALIALVLLAWPVSLFSWGFFGHERINRLAVFSLPPEMVGFYKFHIQFLTENSVNPDRRRYSVKDEAPRHYIDIDHYGDSAIWTMPRYWNQAVEKYTEDTLKAYGIVPWHIVRVKGWLTNAFANQDADQILRLSADLGHYIADANVPLHTTENYNGQLTGQYGIHGFWESRLPELFFGQYKLFVGQARYLENPQLEAWKAVTNAHLALDSVLRFEKELTRDYPESKKFVVEQRGNVNIRTYSEYFSAAYHKRLNGMVERRMKASIKMIADFWYTAWVDGGQPNLDNLVSKKWKPEKEKLAAPPEVLPTGQRNHESGEVVK
jgi:hypothetical protein